MIVKLQNEKIELKKQLDYFKYLYDRIPLAYQSLDESGNIIEVNPAWLETLGYKRKEVIGKPISVFLPKKEHSKLKIEFSNFKKVGSVRVEFRFIKKDKSEELFDVVGKIGYDSQGNFLQTHCILTPVSAIKDLNDVLLKKNKDLETFNKIAVQRELKMIELKNIISKLNERISILEKQI